MPQAKKKQTQKTAAKRKTTGAKKKACTRTCACRKQVNEREKMHVYIVTAMSMIVAILLCADAAIMMNI